MRHKNHIVPTDQGRRWEIGDIFAQFAGVQSLHQVFLVDDLLTGKVQQAGFRLERAQQFRIDKATGGIQYWQVQGYIVTAGEQGRQGIGFAHLARQAPGGLYRQGRIVTDDLHTHGKRHLGDHRADRAKADDTQRLADEFIALELLFLRLEGAVHLGLVSHARKGIDVANTLDDAARTEQHGGRHQFFHRVGVGPG